MFSVWLVKTNVRGWNADAPSRQQVGASQMAMSYPLPHVRTSSQRACDPLVSFQVSRPG